jgi:hypothetical protein
MVFGRRRCWEFRGVVRGGRRLNGGAYVCIRLVEGCVIEEVEVSVWDGKSQRRGSIES